MIRPTDDKIPINHNINRTRHVGAKSCELGGLAHNRQVQYTQRNGGTTSISARAAAESPPPVSRFVSFSSRRRDNVGPTPRQRTCTQYYLVVKTDWRRDLEAHDRRIDQNAINEILLPRLYLFYITPRPFLHPNET